MLRMKSYDMRKNEAGSVLLVVAGSMVMLLAVCAIAIDLANFYLARAQAQRAADAAALAGAKAFVTSGCTTGGCNPGGIQETIATQQAEAAAAQNYIAGQPANINPNKDVVFSYPNPYEPQITVTAGRSVPTMFAKIFGIQAVNVSATSTAEAYNPAGGGGANLGAACLKPFLVPDCDPTPGQTSPGNPNCPGQGYFFDTSTTPPTIEHPGVYPAGVIGMPWQLHTEAAPSQWYLVGFNGAPPSSASALRDHIEMCTPAILSCGDTLTTANGKNVGPTDQGINTLIYANGDGPNQGQDSIDTTTGPPFPITGGMNNPNPALRGKVFYDYSESPSVVTVPVYNGVPLTAGGSTVQIDGYMQVFIKQANHTGQDVAIDVVILNVSLCNGTNGGGGGGNGTLVAAAGSSVPIRLIRTN